MTSLKYKACIDNTDKYCSHQDCHFYCDDNFCCNYDDFNCTVKRWKDDDFVIINLFIREYESMSPYKERLLDFMSDYHDNEITYDILEEVGQDMNILIMSCNEKAKYGYIKYPDNYCTSEESKIEAERRWETDQKKTDIEREHLMDLYFQKIKEKFMGG